MSACPICHRSVLPRSENKAFPFCSARCKQIDLGKWLGGEYRIETNEMADDTSNVDATQLAAGNREETS